MTRVRRAMLLSVFANVALLCAAEHPAFVVQGPTIVAFFPPVTAAELGKDADTNEALADFRLYAGPVREPLRKAGIDFQEVYARSFRVRSGAKVTTFRPKAVGVGYYYVAPGKNLASNIVCRATR
jgi:hypothetical protein